MISTPRQVLPLLRGYAVGFVSMAIFILEQP